MREETAESLILQLFPHHGDLAPVTCAVAQKDQCLPFVAVAPQPVHILYGPYNRDVACFVQQPCGDFKQVNILDRPVGSTPLERLIGPHSQGFKNPFFVHHDFGVNVGQGVYDLKSPVVRPYLADSADGTRDVETFVSEETWELYQCIKIGAVDGGELSLDWPRPCTRRRGR